MNETVMGVFDGQN